MASPTPEKQMALIADRQELGALVARYSQCVSLGLGQELVDMFTEDGDFVAGKVSCSGKKELEGIFLRMTPGRLIPLVTNMTFQIEGDQATGASTLFSVMPGETPLTYAGHYQDSFVRENGSWKFSKRHFTFFYDQAGNA